MTASLGNQGWDLPGFPGNVTGTTLANSGVIFSRKTRTIQGSLIPKSAPISDVYRIRNSHLCVAARPALEALGHARNREPLGAASIVTDLLCLADGNCWPEAAYDERIARDDRNAARHQRRQSEWGALACHRVARCSAGDGRQSSVWHWRRHCSVGPRRTTRSSVSHSCQQRLPEGSGNPRLGASD